MTVKGGFDVSGARKRLGDFRDAMGWGPLELMDAMNAMIGARVIREPHVYGWEGESRSLTRQTLAQVALLHPTDPRGCFEWFIGRRQAMPRIPVDRAAKRSEQRGVAATSVGVVDDSKGVPVKLAPTAKPPEDRQAGGRGK